MTEQPQVDTRTTKRRWKDAVGALHRAGIPVRQNVVECCRSCIFAEMNETFDGGPYAFTYGSQGGYTFWYGDALMQKEYKSSKYCKSLALKIHWQCSDDETEKLIVESFRANGFEVKWDRKHVPTILLDEDDQGAKYMKQRHPDWNPDYSPADHIAPGASTVFDGITSDESFDFDDAAPAS